MFEACVELFESEGWRPRSDAGGIRLETRDVRFHRADRGPDDRGAPVQVLRGRLHVDAPRAEVFAYLSDLKQTHEWDPTSGSHEIVEVYDDSTLVMRANNKLPFPLQAREGLLFIVRRAEHSAGRSLVCYRSVSHRACPVGKLPRVLQHTFCWVIDERAPGLSTVGLLVSVPEGMMPLAKSLSGPAWRSILKNIRALVEARARRDGPPPAHPAPAQRPRALARLAAAVSSAGKGLETAIRLLTAPHPLLDEHQLRSPRGFPLRVLREHWTVLTGPEAVKFFYGLDEADADPFALRLRMPTLHLPGVEPPRDLFESTQFTRTMLLARFARQDPDALVDTLRRVAEDALDARLPAEVGHVEDFFGVLLETCALMMARVLLGDAVYRALPGDFAKNYADIEGSLNLVSLIAPWLPSARAHAADAAKRRLLGALWPLVSERRGSLNTDPPDDVLQAYVDARRSDGSPIGFSDGNILWLLNALQWAAHHYPAVHAFWAGVQMLSCPDLLRGVMAEQGRFAAVNAATVGEMTYLQGCLKESIRLHPVTFLPRLVRRDLQYKEHAIPAGSIVALCPYLEHQNPAVFPNPRAFDPERWMGERGRKIPVTSFIPGGGGRWGCVGMRFTLTALTTLWATLLQRFDLTLMDPPAQRGDLILMPPSRPVRMEVRRRAAAPRRDAPAREGLDPP